MLQVITRRNGQNEKFDQTKITQSLTESMVSISLADSKIINTLSDQVIEYLEQNHEHSALSTDDIRSAVNIVFILYLISLFYTLVRARQRRTGKNKKP